MIVGQRFGTAGDRFAVVAGEPLRAVDRRAVHQHAIGFFGRVVDFVHAEKTAHGLRPRLVVGIEPDHGERDSDGEGSLERSAHQQNRRERHGDDRDMDRSGEVSLGYPAKNDARRQHGQCDRNNGRPEQTVPQSPAEPSNRPAENGKHKQDRVLGDPGENNRRNQAGEQAADHAAGGNGQIERRQMLRRRPLPRELTMARHGDGEECQEMRAKIEQQIVGVGKWQQRDDACDGERLGDQHPAVRQPWARLEHQHEGQQIERQRQNPEQRRRRDVGRDVGGHRDQQAGRYRRQESPAAKRQPSRGRRGRGRARGRVGARGRAQQQIGARRDQREQQPKSAAPQADMLAQRQRRFEDEGIGQQRKETADIRGRVEEVRVFAGGMSGAHEPRLQQRSVGGEREERQPDRDRKQPDEPQRRPIAGRVAPTLRDGQRQRQTRRDQQHKMDGDRDRRAQRPHQNMGVGIAGKQHGLEKHHRYRPHRRRTAEPRQHHAREHRLHRKQQQRAGEHRGGEYRQDHCPMPRGRPGSWRR